MPRMNQETKLVFALEHVAHLEDLIEGNDWEDYLKRSVLKLKYEFERQLSNEQVRKRGWMWKIILLKLIGMFFLKICVNR